MIEYDFSIALENIIETDGTKGLLFPNSCILYLRQTKNTREKESLKLLFADGTCAEYRVPIVKVQKLKNIENDQIKQDAFICEFDGLLNELRGCTEIDDTEYSYLLDSIHKVSDHILRHTPVLKERIGEIMGGKVLRLRTDVIIEQSLKKGMKQGLEQGLQQGLQQGRQQGLQQGLEQGRQQGLQQGVFQGRLEAYIELIKNGLITITWAAAKLSMSETELKKHMKDA